MWGHGQMSGSPNLSGSGTAQPPACRAQKFSERSTRHMRALTHGTAPRHGRRPRRKVLRSLTRADLGAIRRICFHSHVCVNNGRFARREQASGGIGRGRRMKRRDRFGPAKTDRSAIRRSGRGAPCSRAGQTVSQVQRRGEAAWPNARSAPGRSSPATREAERGRAARLEARRFERKIGYVDLQLR